MSKRTSIPAHRRGLGKEQLRILLALAGGGLKITPVKDSAGDPYSALKRRGLVAPECDDGSFVGITAEGYRALADHHERVRDMRNQAIFGDGGADG